MDSEEKPFVILLLGLFLAIVVLVLGGMALIHYNDRRMAELGFEESTVPGKQSAVWRKVRLPASGTNNLAGVTGSVRLGNHRLTVVNGIIMDAVEETK